jgi:hypothetical protein
MTSFFAARRQYFAAPHCLHSRAEAVRFVTAAHFRLKGAFRQRILPLDLNNPTKSKHVV